MPRQRMGKRTEMRKTETRRERGALRGRETRDRGGEEPGGRERPGVVEGGDTNPRRQGQPEGRGDIEAQRQRRETRRPGVENQGTGSLQLRETRERPA